MMRRSEEPASLKSHYVRFVAVVEVQSSSSENGLSIFSMYMVNKSNRFMQKKRGVTSHLTSEAGLSGVWGIKSVKRVRRRLYEEQLLMQDSFHRNLGGKHTN